MPVVFRSRWLIILSQYLSFLHFPFNVIVALVIKEHAPITPWVIQYLHFVIKNLLHTSAISITCDVAGRAVCLIVVMQKPTIQRNEPSTLHPHHSYTNTNPSTPSHLPHIVSWL